MKIDIGNIDWQLLREQKLHLIKHDCAETNGLLALIDHIQDEAVKAGVSEAEVFGETSIEMGRLFELMAEFLETCSGNNDSWYASERDVTKGIFETFTNFIYMRGYRS